MYALPGYMMFNKADILYTWYGDKRSDDETGATDILAPIKSGTMTVSKETTVINSYSTSGMMRDTK